MRNFQQQSPEKDLDTATQKEAEKLLQHLGIWKFENHGWLNENDYDPEFMGHAMWQTEPPVDMDYLFVTRPLFNHKERPEPPEHLKQLDITDTDLGGLMSAARFSIGLFLFQANLIQQNLFHNDNLFDLHRMSSIIYLSTASDRLREFLIWAAFRKTPEKYKGTEYTVPFLEAKSEFAHSDGPIKEAIQKLYPLAMQIRVLRKERNKLVHEISTEIARRESEMIRRGRKAKEVKNIDFAAIREVAKKDINSRQEKITQTINELADWYKILVQASNEAFIFENYRRKT
jgi:hypothetical protein